MTRSKSCFRKVMTAREREVWGHIATGKCDKQIARDVKLGLPTVKVHVRGVLMVLGVKNRVQAAIAYVAAHG